MRRFWGIGIVVAALALAGCGPVTVTTPSATVEATVAVPDVVGMAGDEARTALTAEGFLVTFDGGEETVLMASNWTVDSQTPAAGETAEPGATVTLAVSKPIDEFRTEATTAAVLWERVLANFPGGIGTDSPLFAVTEVEDVSIGTIRVYVQENLDDAGREEIARHVFNMGAMDDPTVTTIVVRDASGVDSNHFRSDFSHLVQ